MIKPKLILIGAGGHAHSCIDVIEQHGLFQISGLIGFSEQMHTTHLESEYSVIGDDDDLLDLSKNHEYALITVGHIKTADHRISLYQKVKDLNFQLPTIIAPTAYVSRYAKIGIGTIVMHGAIINAGARIGNNCIINSRALIEHDAYIGDHCHISTGAILNGNVVVGAGSFIGSGSIIKQAVCIGDGCVVGMGVTVRQNLLDYTQFTGRHRS